MPARLAMGYHAPMKAVIPTLKYSLFLLFAGMMLQAGGLHAAEVAGLYQANVEIGSRDDERQRNQAFTAGLRQVLVKLTGSSSTLNNPGLASALGRAQSYVETWAYSTGQTEGNIMLQVAYYESEIQRLLNQSGIPIWPQSRPETLLWVVVQDELGQPRLAGTPTAEAMDILTSVQEIASQRALPLLLPLMDFTDLSAMQPALLWNFDMDAIRGASSRYNTESILALRIVRLLNGEVIAKARHIFRDRIQEFEIREAALLPFLEGSISMVAEELAANYAILLSGISDSSQVNIHVEGINSRDDYAGLMSYLRGLAVVKDVRLVSVDGNELQLVLGTGGQFRQLIESLALDKRLVALADPVRTNDQVSMRYAWQSP